MNIRTATMSDLDAVTAVEAVCFPAAEAAARDTMKDRLLHYPNHFWLLEDGDQVVSFVNGLVTNQEHLEDIMFVDASMHDEYGAWQMIFGVDTIPKYQRQGCAARLLRYVIEAAREQGRMGLVLTCKDHMIHYYAKFGFVDEGFSRSNHGGAVWHEMRLTF